MSKGLNSNLRTAGDVHHEVSQKPVEKPPIGGEELSSCSRELGTYWTSGKMPLAEDWRYRSLFPGNDVMVPHTHIHTHTLLFTYLPAHVFVSDNGAIEMKELWQMPLKCYHSPVDTHKHTQREKERERERDENIFLL